MQTFLATAILAWIHSVAPRARELNRSTQGWLLSTGGGVAIAYIFVDILPKLGASELVVKEALSGFFPYFERHVYVLALAGFLLFFVISKTGRSKVGFRLSLASYSLLNFLIGYAISDKDDPEVQPLVLFTLAMALHYFINDYSLSEKHPFEFNRKSRLVLVLLLFAGWGVGQYYQLDPTAVALIGAFIAGGVIMNVTQHELPEENPHDLRAFLLAAIGYTAVLLFIGKDSILSTLFGRV